MNRISVLILPTWPLPLALQFEQTGDRSVFGSSHTGQSLLIRGPIDARVLPFDFIRHIDLLVKYLVRRFDIGAEGRVGQNYIEPALKNTVDVEETIVMMYGRPVAVAVHDHVHFAGAAIRSLRSVP